MLIDNTRHILLSMFEHEKYPVHQLTGYLDYGLLGIHPFTVSLVGHRHCRVFPYGYPGSLDYITAQHGMLAKRDVTVALTFPAGVTHGDQSDVGGQRIGTGKPSDIVYLDGQRHGRGYPYSRHGSKQTYRPLKGFTTG
ncbi:hypothetical protein SDC9_135245 [bioreactor metagenome]|uniref:Uncharacterized protein n=1 Tax=bioreactor metagenome TaxID=1076179 RepID=A0A645DFB0_9ZZZZ